MNFTKMQGAGNDFVLIESSDTKKDWPPIAKAMCDRHYGIGADGILVLLPSKKADFRMRIFNADGSEADACGNGLRCIVKYFVENGPAKSKTGDITVETMAGVRKAKVFKIASGTNVQVGMGKPILTVTEIPAKLGQGKVIDIKSMTNYSMDLDGWKLSLDLVSMGNPHAVFFFEKSPDDFPLSEIGPQVEHHKIFPRGVNFEVARLIDKDNIEARVWERGVGETLACGSGACAIGVAAQLRGYTGKKTNIKLPGGTLEVEWDGKGEILLSGPAVTVFNGQWPD